MIKLISTLLIGGGLIGTGVHTFTPQSLEFTAGSIILRAGVNGTEVDIAPNPDFAISLKTKGNRKISLSL